MSTSCEFNDMEYENESSVDPNLLCTICEKPLKDPVCTPCDHTYGRACIKEWLQKNKKNSCPTCMHTPLTMKDLTVANRPLRNMLDIIRVRCTMCGEENLTRGSFLIHKEKRCTQATVHCKAADIKCPWTGLRGDADNHQSECPFEKLRPVLSFFMAENQKLNELVQKHIKTIRPQPSRPAPIPKEKENSDDDSDAVSITSVPGANFGETSAIYIRNIPPTVQVNQLLTIFSKVGPIKDRYTVGIPDISVFSSTTKNGLRSARINYKNQASVQAAINEFDGKQIPGWNTRLRVGVWRPKKNLKDVATTDDETNELQSAVDLLNIDEDTVSCQHRNTDQAGNQATASPTGGVKERRRPRRGGQ